MKHPYATHQYAAALSHVGRVVDVPYWGTSVIARLVPGTVGCWDITGTYPIAALDHDADLRGGLNELRKQGFISVALALDEFHRPPDGEHWACFNIMRTFKTHYVHRGHQSAIGGAYKPSKGHARHIAKARKAVEVRAIKLEDHLERWLDLYSVIVEKHGMTGVHDFSRDYFSKIGQVPGIETLAGFIGPEMVCANIWAVHGGRAHSHLVASNMLGYETEAAYAVTDQAFWEFAHCDLINLGGGAGVDDSDEGLCRFKKGFCNSTSQGYIAGAILDPDGYERLTPGRNTDFFPAYRG